MSTHTHDPRPVVGLAFDEPGELPACAGCETLHADALAARGALLPEGLPSDAVWERIQAQLDALARVKVVLSCTYCKDGLQRVEAVYCASCLAPHHGDCFAGHGRCSAPGCQEIEVVRSRPAAEREAAHPATRVVTKTPPSSRTNYAVLAALAMLFVLLVPLALLNQKPVTSSGGGWGDEGQAEVEVWEEEVPARPRYVSGTPTQCDVQAREADARVVLWQLAELGHADLILPPELQGTLTTQLQDVHWLSALHAVVRTLGAFELIQEGEGGLLRVVPTASIEHQVGTRIFDVQRLTPGDVEALLPSLELLAGVGKLEDALVTHVPGIHAVIVHTGKPALLQVQRLLEEVGPVSSTDPFGPDPADAELDARVIDVQGLARDEVEAIVQRIGGFESVSVIAEDDRLRLVVAGHRPELDALEAAIRERAPR